MGYSEAPWNFRGRALYQLSLVRVEEARKYVPPDLPLVNCFGWTLGGLYLARYSDSPVGAFDECVALAGLAWDFPASCAWAARVYVNNREARDHGISTVGLPSRLAAFRAVPPAAAPARAILRGGSGSRTSTGTSTLASGSSKNCVSWWDLPVSRNGKGGNRSTGSAAATGPTLALDLCNLESTTVGPRQQGVAGGGRGRGAPRGLAAPVCRLSLPQLPNPGPWAPQIHLYLPSFSGATPDHPGLLKYCLKLVARIRPLPPLRVTPAAERAARREAEGGRAAASAAAAAAAGGGSCGPEVLDAVLCGRPLLCLAFEDMHMEVQPPEPWQPRRRQAATAGASGATARVQPAAA